jgi:hypothetical protein
MVSTWRSNGVKKRESESGVGSLFAPTWRPNLGSPPAAITGKEMMPVKPSEVAASTGIARAITALQQHGCKQISSFAQEVLASSGSHIAANSGKKGQGTDAPPFGTKTARAYMFNINKVKTTHHAAPTADIMKKMLVSDAPP